MSTRRSVGERGFERDSLLLMLLLLRSFLVYKCVCACRGVEERGKSLLVRRRWLLA